MTAIPAFGLRNRPSDFFVGLSLPFRAVALVFRTRKLFLLSSIAAAVTFVALVGLVAFAAAYTGGLVRYFVFTPESWYGQALFWLVSALTFVVLVLVGLNTVPLLMLAPLQDPLGEAAEEVLGDFKAPDFSVSGLARGTWVSLWHTGARILSLLAGHAVLLLLHLIPGVGSALWTVLSGLWTVLWLSIEYLDAPMTRHFYPFGEVRKVALARLPASLGFGAALWVILWVPVLNLFLIPTAVVAGTLLFRGLRACGALGPPPPTT